MKPVKGIEQATQTGLIHDPYEQPRGMSIAGLDIGIRNVSNDALIQLTLHDNSIDGRCAETQKMV